MDHVLVCTLSSLTENNNWAASGGPFFGVSLPATGAGLSQTHKNR